MTEFEAKKVILKNSEGNYVAPLAYSAKYSDNGRDLDNLDFTTKNLDNLQDSGNYRFEYAPFSINKGRSDISGENATLYYLGETVIDSWTQPTLTGNGTMGGSHYATSASSSVATQPYDLINGSTWYTSSQSSATQWWQFYAPEGICITKFTYRVYSGSSYTSNDTVALTGSMDGSSWTTLVSGVRSGNYTKANSGKITVTLNCPANTQYYKYYRITNSTCTSNSSGYFWAMYGGQITATYQIFPNALNCAPCTVTSTNNETKDFSNVQSLDCSILDDGEYRVYKNIENGALSVDMVSWNTDRSVPLQLFPIKNLGCEINKNGIVNGFTAYNYLQLKDKFMPQSSDTWEIIFDVTTGGDVTTNQTILSTGEFGVPHYYGCHIQTVSSLLKLRIGKGDGSSYFAETTGLSLLANTHYLFKCWFDGTDYSFSYKTDEMSDFTLVGSISNESMAVGDTYSLLPVIGAGSPYQGTYSYPWLGTIDIKNSYININNETWWSGNEDKSNLVYLGNVTVASGNITDIYNVGYNATRGGNPTSKYSQVLASGATAPTSDVSFKLNLPDDGFDYEVWFSGYGASGSTNGNRNYIYLANFRATNAYIAYMGYVVTRSKAYVLWMNNCKIPILSNRVVRVGVSSSNTGSYNISSGWCQRLSII